MALVLRYKWWALGAEEEVSRGAWFRRQFQASLLINKHAVSHLHIAHILFMIVGARARARASELHATPDIVSAIRRDSRSTHNSP